MRLSRLQFAGDLESTLKLAPNISEQKTLMNFLNQPKLTFQNRKRKNSEAAIEMIELSSSSGTTTPDQSPVKNLTLIFSENNSNESENLTRDSAIQNLEFDNQSNKAAVSSNQEDDDDIIFCGNNFDVENDDCCVILDSASVTLNCQPQNGLKKNRKTKLNAENPGNKKSKSKDKIKNSNLSRYFPMIT